MNDTTSATQDLVAAELTARPNVEINLENLRQLADDAGTRIAKIHLKEAGPGLPVEIPVLLDRKNGKVASLKTLIEEQRTKPARKTGSAVITTLDSFVALSNRHKTPHSVIFADTDWREPSLTTVVDYHDDVSGGPADNGRHRIHYPFPLSEEWKAWVGQDGKLMDQEAFAEWIEEHLPELATPDAHEVDDIMDKFGYKIAKPNEMAMLSRGLQVHVGSKVKNNVALQSGEGEITWEEEHRDAAGNKINVPGMFILAVPPFFMGEVTRIPVRLRYRVVGGSIKWVFKLHRPDIYISEQIERDLALAADQTALPHFRGKPEMSA